MTEAEKQKLSAHPGWRWCTPQGDRDQVLLIGLETTFQEKLEWLEAAEDLSLKFQAGSGAHPNPPAGGAALNDAPPAKPTGK